MSGAFVQVSAYFRREVATSERDDDVVALGRNGIRNPPRRFSAAAGIFLGGFCWAAMVGLRRVLEISLNRRGSPAGPHAVESGPGRGRPCGWRSEPPSLSKPSPARRWPRSQPGGPRPPSDGYGPTNRRRSSRPVEDARLLLPEHRYACLGVAPSTETALSIGTTPDARICRHVGPREEAVHWRDVDARLLRQVRRPRGAAVAVTAVSRSPRRRRDRRRRASHREALQVSRPSRPS